jgi:hypothetical protein
LKENPDISLEIESKIRSKHNLPLTVAAAVEKKE